MKPPLPNSYWVEPGRLLAGEHPDGGSEAATRQRLTRLLEAGVRVFVDLTHPDELPAYHGLLPADVTYENFPIPDHSVPGSAQVMRDIQRVLERHLQEGSALYVHCRAGIGRTGTAVGCYLREQGQGSDQALARLNQLWLQCARSARWPTVPETEEQEQFVRAWRVVRTADALSLQRYRGALVGLAVGDALASGKAQVPAAWTDDTAMALCVAESLLAQGSFDGRDQLARYRAWAADPSAQGAAADAALRPVVRTVLARAVWNRTAMVGSHDPAQTDPSPLGRCTAVALFARGQAGVASTLGADVARVTHQAPVLVDACRLFSGMLCLALKGLPRHRVLAADAELGGLPLRDEVRELASQWRGSVAGRHRVQAGVLGTLDRAARCFARSSGFDEGLERALASRSEDRDAICAAYGALAGAFHGEDAIGIALRARVSGLERIERLADRLYGQGSAVHGSVA